MSSVLWRGVFLVLAVFAGGVLVGALGLRAWAQHGHMGRVFIEGREARDWREGRDGREGREGPGPRDWREGRDRGVGHMLRSLDRRVGLEGDQRDRVEEILTQSHAERRQLLLPVEPALGALRKRTEGRIRGLLRGEQRPAFDDFAAHLAERHAREFLPGPGHPPGDEPPLNP